MDENFIIEPHIHMLARTTDEYEAMYKAGIRVCVEPSFWLGENRRWAESFWDYFNLILNFETVRARRSGIDHFCAIGTRKKAKMSRSLLASSTAWPNISTTRVASRLAKSASTI